MRIFSIQGDALLESSSLQDLHARGLPDQGFVWIACDRNEFEAHLEPLQASFQALCGLQLPEHPQYFLLSQSMRPALIEDCFQPLALAQPEHLHVLAPHVCQ